MGYDAINPRGSSFDKRARDHEALFRSIHRARVTDLFIEEGTIAVTLENVAYSAKVTIPLLGLSAPPSLTDSSRADFKSASWGRYIPQVGDLILVGFGSNGDLYALGYSAIFYKGFNIADISEEGTGGVGWGDVSAKTMHPGDWDFRSSRRSTLYLGEKAALTAGPYSIEINQPTKDITISTPLLIGSIGSSKLLYGVAERFVSPTDDEPSAISTSRAGKTAQEATVKVKWDGGPTDGQELATWSMGDVIDDDGATAQIRLSNASSPQPVRRYFNSVDSTGYVASFTEIVDSNGNYEVSSSLASEFKWDTTLAAWEINNLSLSWTATDAIEFSSNSTINLTGNAGVVLDSSATIQFGGTGASEPMVLGTKWQTFITILLTALSTHTHPTAAPGLPSVSADFTAQVANLTSKATEALSTKVLGS